METLLPPQLGDEEDCPYLENQKARMEYFFAHGLSPEEFEDYLSRGWRKFGLFFFKPNCLNCQACQPIRVDVNKFSPSKSQRRLLRKNQDLRVEFTPLEYDPAIYRLYLTHTKGRFPDKPENLEDEEQFLETHFIPSVPSRLSKFYLNDELIAVGFLDLSKDGLSSVYFVFDPKYSSRSLGTFGALKELEYAQILGLPYYYLGYYIKDNRSMNYKNSFRPYEIYDWNEKRWLTQENQIPPIA